MTQSEMQVRVLIKMQEQEAVVILHCSSTPAAVVHHSNMQHGYLPRAAPRLSFFLPLTHTMCSKSPLQACQENSPAQTHTLSLSLPPPLLRGKEKRGKGIVLSLLGRCAERNIAHLSEHCFAKRHSENTLSSQASTMTALSLVTKKWFPQPLLAVILGKPYLKEGQEDNSLKKGGLGFKGVFYTCHLPIYFSYLERKRAIQTGFCKSLKVKGIFSLPANHKTRINFVYSNVSSVTIIPRKVAVAPFTSAPEYEEFEVGI